MHNALPHERRIGDTFLTKYFVNSCNGFICLSESVIEDLSLLTKNPNHRLVPHPVYDIFGEKVTKQAAREYLGLKQDEKVLLFFGIIRKYKGLELLLNALADTRLKEMNMKLIVAGEFYEDKNQYMNLVQQNGLTGKVLFTDGFIENDEVKHYFCASDIIVQPYISATQSGVTQIAYHFERPMLVTNVGGLAEIISNGVTGYVTDVDEKQVADALIDFYVNNREDAFSKNVAGEKHRFSWQVMANEIFKLAKEI
jgi:glycosyltransferase involved in cell wall biosynthesis